MGVCDCLNDCGDDPDLRKGRAQPCDWRQQEVKRLQAKQQAEAALVVDAARYRCLRSAHWFRSSLCVVRDPKNNVKLGADCPSEERLDAFVDAFMANGTAS